uniref:Cadherin domain-containing protein n=1 Tax=Mesocestoides corti TaxID=53468 RepID=A0A5K3FFR0_MESCO
MLLLILLPTITVFAHFPPNCSLVVQENLARGHLIALPYTSNIFDSIDQFTLQITNSNPYFGVLSGSTGIRVPTLTQHRQNPWRVWYPKDPSPLSTQWCLVTLQRIDRERLCQTEPGCDCQLGDSHPNRLGGGPDCAIPLRLVAIPTKKERLPSVIDLTICIADENDNPPTFQTSSSSHFGASSTMSVHFKEDAQIGELVTLPAGSDADAYPEHTVSSYDLNCPGSDALFSLVYDTHTPDRLDLRVDKILKFDSQWPLLCTVTAFDGQHSGSMQLKIHLDDVNNHKPVWKKPNILNSAITIVNETSDEWVIDMPESVLPFTVLLQLKASDDDPVYGKLTFSAEGEKKGPLLFDVDSRTGEVRLVSKQDYKTVINKELNLRVAVTDNGGLSTLGRLRFQLRDVNDNRPVIRFSGGDKQAEVVENSQSDVYIDYVTVSDTDSGAFGQVECRLKPGTLSDHFQLTKIGEDLWAFQAVKPIDRELLAAPTATRSSRFYARGTRVGITVVCNDNPGALKDYQLSTEATIQVTILDQNDNPPKFVGIGGDDPSVIEVAILEGLPPGTPVIRITADDPDIGDTLTYALLPTANKKFSIDPVSGLIITQCVFDREEEAILTGFKVVVFDGGHANHTISADLRVTILDQNDNNPVFHSQTVIIAPEDKPVDSLLHTINATDADAGENGTVVLFFAQHQQIPEPFTLYPDGRLFLTRPLDRERQEHYELIIIAADKGTPSLSSTMTLVVQVEDINDSPPRFELAVRSFLKTVPCTQTYAALELAATDADSLPENTVINYRILDVKGPFGDTSGRRLDLNRENSLFYIQPDSGALFLHGQHGKNLPEFDPCDYIGVYRLNIMAFDPSKPLLNSNTTVTLHITRPPTMEEAPPVKSLLSESGNTLINSANYSQHALEPPSNRYAHLDDRESFGTGEDGQSRSSRMTFLGILLLITVFIGLTLLLILIIYFIKKRISADESLSVDPQALSSTQYLPGMTLKKDEFLSDAYSPTPVYGTARNARCTEPIECTYCFFHIHVTFRHSKTCYFA